MKVLIFTYELHNIRRIRSLVFAITSNGTKITNNLHQVIAGLKVVDVGAINPITNKFIKPQSCNICWPTRIVLGRETELMCTNFTNPECTWWDDCDCIDSENQRNNLYFPDLKPFNLCYTNDMSARWKLTKKGGYSKTK